MEELFTDQELNQRANNITTAVNRITGPIRLGISMQKLFNNTGLIHAKSLLDQTKDDLKYIKDKVGAKNEVYLNLSVGVGMKSLWNAIQIA